MLEGLEIAEIGSADVLTGDIRLEAIFYTSESFCLSASFMGEQILDSASYNSVYGLNSEGIGYPTLRMHEFTGLFAGKPKMFADGLSSEDFALHSLKKDDVLICRTNGNPKLIGKSALVASDQPFVYESHLFKIRPKRELINSAALVVFLNTKYGRIEIERFSMQGNQANFSLAKFREIRIPKFGYEFCCAIEKAVYLAFSQLENSQGKICQAESHLLNAIGMKKFSPPSEIANVKSFKNSFASTGRLDAEHYQPKYEALYQALAKNNRVFKLGDHLSFNQRGSQPDYAEEGFPVINSKHVQRGHVNMGDTRFANVPDKTNAVVIQQGDVLMNGTGVGTIGRAAPYLHTAKALPDNHVTVLRKDAMSAICLALYLNSIAGQYQVDQHFKGSSGQIELYPADIANFWCPELSQSTQQQIDKLAQQSFSLKVQSERLLEAAKRAIEIAIEQDEEAGMAYLEREGSCT